MVIPMKRCGWNNKHSLLWEGTAGLVKSQSGAILNLRPCIAVLLLDHPRESQNRRFLGKESNERMSDNVSIVSVEKINHDTNHDDIDASIQFLVGRPR
jgi:hypothetical protein